jgi:hypothetical protein
MKENDLMMIMGYGSVFEEDLFLTFESGVIKDKRVVDNTGKGLPNQPRKPGAMSPAAFTSLPIRN